MDIPTEALAALREAVEIRLYQSVVRGMAVHRVDLPLSGCAGCPDAQELGHYTLTVFFLDREVEKEVLYSYLLLCPTCLEDRDIQRRIGKDMVNLRDRVN